VSNEARAFVRQSANAKSSKGEATMYEKTRRKASDSSNPHRFSVHSCYLLIYYKQSYLIACCMLHPQSFIMSFAELERLRPLH
jgi:hypothetical protein